MSIESLVELEIKAICPCGNDLRILYIHRYGIGKLEITVAQCDNPECIKKRKGNKTKGLRSWESKMIAKSIRIAKIQGGKEGEGE